MHLLSVLVLDAAACEVVFFFGCGRILLEEEDGGLMV